MRTLAVVMAIAALAACGKTEGTPAAGAPAAGSGAACQGNQPRLELLRQFEEALEVPVA